MLPEPGRARACVVFAARSVRSAGVRAWLRGDERGTFEEIALDMLRRLPPTTDAELGREEVDRQVAFRLAGLALQASLRAALATPRAIDRSVRRSPRQTR